VAKTRYWSSVLFHCSPNTTGKNWRTVIFAGKPGAAIYRRFAEKEPYSDARRPKGQIAAHIIAVCQNDIQQLPLTTALIDISSWHSCKGVAH